MHTNSKVELKLRNGSYSLIVVIMIIIIFLGYMVIVTKHYSILLVLGLTCIFLAIGTLRLRELNFTNDSLFYRSLRNKKVLWSLPYSSIKQIRVDYLSDTKINNKKLQILLRDGTNYKANVTNTTMEELGKICQVHGVKLYYDLNNRYIEYQLPSYIKIK